MSDENGQMPDIIERELNSIQHVEVAAKSLTLLADRFGGYEELFHYIDFGHEQSTLHVLAFMSSYRLTNQDMTKDEHESNKLACLYRMQALEEELRPMLEYYHAQVVDDMYNTGD